MESEPRRREESEGRREEENAQNQSADFFWFRATQERRLDVELEALAHAVTGAGIEVSRIPSPGLPEACYRIALSQELTLRDISHQCEAPIPLAYKGAAVGQGKADILVANRLVVELKVVEHLAELHRAQVIAYLSALHLELGLQIDFNVIILADRLKRVIRTKT